MCDASNMRVFLPPLSCFGLQEVFEVISPSSVRRLKDERPGNVEALLRMAVSHLEKVRGGGM